MLNPFKIRQIEQGEKKIFQKLIRLFQEVFEMETEVIAKESYLSELLQKTGFIAYGVFLEDEIVGGATAYMLPGYYIEQAELFIYDIAMKPAYQQKGAGRQLIGALKNYCAENNIKTIFLMAHTADRHALNFYQATNGIAEDVTLFTYNT